VERLKKRIRVLITGIIIGLILSGLTAFPLQKELNIFASLLGASPDSLPNQFSGLL